MNTSNPLIKVLVVDDQPLIVEELCEFLESSGYRCVPCNTTREAIDAFVADSEIGLVLCDLLAIQLARQASDTAPFPSRASPLPQVLRRVLPVRARSCRQGLIPDWLYHPLSARSTPESRVYSCPANAAG